VGAERRKSAQQAKKGKTRGKSRKRRVRGALVVSTERPPGFAPIVLLAVSARRVRMPRVLQRTRQTIKPMSVSDAARELDAGDGLVIFRDLDRDSISVLYRQRNGELTLVETEA